ncbi:MAG: alkaline phosphatase D family protein [Gemmataceae bacterium]
MRYAAFSLPLLAVCVVLGAAEAPADNRITTGPMLGRLGATHIGVWARTAHPGTFQVRYGPRPDQLDQVSPPVPTTFARDCTGWVLLKGLKSNTKYFYRVEVPGQKEHPPRLSGSFRTLPSPDDYRDAEHNPKGLFNFQFEFACGNNQNPKHGSGPELPAFKTMLDQLKDQIDFAILNGDWLYEEEREYSVAEWMRQVGCTPNEVPRDVWLAPTIVGVWENYKLYLERGKNLAAWHREIPSFFTLDDHEILNDIWGTGTAGLRDRRAVFRDIGVQAWQDYLGWSNPAPFTQGAVFGKAELKKGSDILTDPEADFTQVNFAEAANLHVHWGGPTAGVNDNNLDTFGGDPNAGVYDIVKVIDRHQLQIRPPARETGTAAYSIGRRTYFQMRVSNCDFFCLDTRSHRDMHDIKQRDKPGISMLGQAQKEWLLDGMSKSDAEFFFVVSSVNFMIPHVGGEAIREGGKDEAWTVFLEEREQLINFWDKLGRPVFVLTGDLHNSFAIRITDRVWEFASGPHNSGNHLIADEGDRPANGPYDSFGRQCDIRWSSYFLNDIPRSELRHPFYCVVQINNVFNNPLKVGEQRWVAFPRPQVLFKYHDGRTGQLLYAESIHATR